MALLFSEHAPCQCQFSGSQHRTEMTLKMAGSRQLPCYHPGMKQRASKSSAASTGRNIVLGRSAFKKISAVEGIKLSNKSEALFAEFDRNGLSAEERRQILLKRHAKKA